MTTPLAEIVQPSRPSTAVHPTVLTTDEEKKVADIEQGSTSSDAYGVGVTIPTTVGTEEDVGYQRRL